MNTRNTLITLVIGFVLLITACTPASTFVATPTPCAGAVEKAVQAMEANPAFHAELFKQTAYNGFLYADDFDPALKAGIFSERVYLTNRPLSNAIDLAEKCNIPAPLLDASISQLSQAYGPYYLLGKDNDLYVGSVFGGSPELDYDVMPTYVKNGETIVIFGTAFRFKFVGDRPADISTPIDLMVYSVKSELGYMAVGTLNGKFIFAHEGEVVVVQVVK